MMPGEGGVEPGLVAVAVRPGFGGAGGEDVRMFAPPTTGAAFAAPPILFCGVLAPPNAVWAKVGEATETASAPASMHRRMALFFMASTSLAFRCVRIIRSTRRDLSKHRR